jgi:hypothetical protein
MNSLAEKRHVLLQDSRTRMFYIRNGDWTRDPAHARNFVTTQAAEMYSRTWGMSEAEPVHFLPYDPSPRSNATA